MTGGKVDALAHAKQLPWQSTAAPAGTAETLWAQLQKTYPDAAADKSRPVPLSGFAKQLEACLPAALRDHNALNRQGIPNRIVTGRLPNGQMHAIVTLANGQPVGGTAWGATKGFVPQASFDEHSYWMVGPQE